MVKQRVAEKDGDGERQVGYAGNRSPRPRSWRHACPVPPSSGGVAPPCPVLIPPSSGGVAPPPRAYSASEMDEIRRDRLLAVLGSKIIRSGPAVRIEEGGFPEGAILEAAYKVAIMWTRAGRSNDVEKLIGTYGLDGTRVEELARHGRSPEPDK